MVAVETRLPARPATAFYASLRTLDTLDTAGYPADVDGQPSPLTVSGLSPNAGSTADDGGPFWLMAVATLSAPAALNELTCRWGRDRDHRELSELTALLTFPLVLGGRGMMSDTVTLVQRQDLYGLMF